MICSRVSRSVETLCVHAGPSSDSIFVISPDAAGDSLSAKLLPGVDIVEGSFESDNDFPRFCAEVFSLLNNASITVWWSAGGSLDILLSFSRLDINTRVARSTTREESEERCFQPVQIAVVKVMTAFLLYVPPREMC